MENTTKTTKTQKEMYTELLALVKGEEVTVSTEDFTTFIEGRIKLLDNRNSKSEKEKEKKAAEYQENKEILLGALTSEGMTATALRDKTGLSSTQKVTSVLKKMLEDDLVKKETVKGKALYSLNTDNKDDSSETVEE